jgi:hypothetical protein
LDDGRVGARAFRWPPLRLVRLRCERECVDVVCPSVLPPRKRKEEQVRASGWTSTSSFARWRSPRRERSALLGGSPRSRRRSSCSRRAWGAEDRVALEVTGNAWEIKRIIEPHVDRVLVVSPNGTRIRQARGEDRPPRRAHAGEAARIRWARLGLGAGPRHLDDAPAASAPRPARLGALAGQEPDPRHADALPGRPRPVQGALQAQGPTLERSPSPKRSANRSTRRCARSSSSMRRSPPSSD